jgi:hypothetical protein
MTRDLCLPLLRRPRLRRPTDWIPRPGDSLLFVRGGEYPIRTVTLLRAEVDPGKRLVAWDRFIARIPIDRLYPYPGWREQHVREDLEAAVDLDEETGLCQSPDPLPF